MKSASAKRVSGRKQFFAKKAATTALIKSLRGSLKGTGVMRAMMEDRKRERNL